MAHRIFVAASNQKYNIGVGQFGTEQDRMHVLADRTKYWLGTQGGRFAVFRNPIGCTLKQTVNLCNNLACDLFIDNHSDAGKREEIAGDGGAEGTTTFYWNQGGIDSDSHRLASLLYKYISPLSPGVDRGILPDNAYVGSLYVIQNTNCPSSLVEHIFHTNSAEVIDILANMDKYAKAEAMAISKYCDERWIEPNTKEYTIDLLISEMVKDGIITSRDEWTDVMSGRRPANPEWLQIAFRRAVDKI